jgi:8-hydroxy-5-deazaflavin:NADPH oxidoreductase
MSYAIIGFGKIGHALAKAFARNGIEVSVATTRDPQSFASAAAAIGPTIMPKKLAEAVKADIVFLAVRFESHPDVAKALPNWKGKIIIDVTNAYGVPPEKRGGQPSSKVVAQAFPGARLVARECCGLSEGELLVQARGNSWGRLIFKDLINFDR